MGKLPMTMQVLLVEDHNLGQAESLLPTLEKQGYHVFLAHTLEHAVQQLQALWPNLIVFNQTKNIQLANFREDIDKVNLKIPHIVVADQTNPTDHLVTGAILVAAGKGQQLAQG